MDIKKNILQSTLAIFQSDFTEAGRKLISLSSEEPSAWYTDSFYEIMSIAGLTSIPSHTSIVSTFPSITCVEREGALNTFIRLQIGKRQKPSMMFSQMTQVGEYMAFGFDSVVQQAGRHKLLEKALAKIRSQIEFQHEPNDVSISFAFIDAKPNKGNNTDALVYIQPETKKYRSSYQAIIPFNNDEAQERVILAVMAVCLSDIFVSTHSEKYIAAVNSMNNRTAMGQGGPDKLPNLLVYRRQKNYSNNPAENPLHKVYQMYRPLAHSLLSEAAGILPQTQGDLCIPGEG